MYHRPILNLKIRHFDGYYCQEWILILSCRSYSAKSPTRTGAIVKQINSYGCSRSLSTQMLQQGDAEGHGHITNSEGYFVKGHLGMGPYYESFQAKLWTKGPIITIEAAPSLLELRARSSSRCLVYSALLDGTLERCHSPATGGIDFQHTFQAQGVSVPTHPLGMVLKQVRIRV